LGRAIGGWEFRCHSAGVVEHLPSVEELGGASKNIRRWMEVLCKLKVGRIKCEEIKRRMSLTSRDISAKCSKGNKIEN
jgi:hypothetical protein